MSGEKSNTESKAADDNYWTVIGAIRGLFLASPFLFISWGAYSSAYSLAHSVSSDGQEFADGHYGVSEPLQIDDSIRFDITVGLITSAIAIGIVTAMALLHRRDA